MPVFEEKIVFTNAVYYERDEIEITSYVFRGILRCYVYGQNISQTKHYTLT